MNVTPLEFDRLAQAKAAYTTHRIDFDHISTLLTGDITPQPGDLLLARVETLGQHDRLDLPTGRKAKLYVGNEIVLCYGNRYAPDQFEAEIPQDLSPCHLAAAGGIASRVLSCHSKITKPPTEIRPVGLLGDRNGQRINLKQWALQPLPFVGDRPITVAVVGASMNAGKTTTAATWIRGLTEAGMRVGAAKITGTGAGNDTWMMYDAGAKVVLDFTDFGFPSTYQITTEEVLNVFNGLTNYLAAQRVDVIVLEVADGLYQAETANLISSPLFRNTVDGVIYAAISALGAVGAEQWLRRHELPILGISGLVTASPLAAREVKGATHLPVWDLEMLHQEAMSFAFHLPDRTIERLFESDRFAMTRNIEMSVPCVETVV